MKTEKDVYDVVISPEKVKGSKNYQVTITHQKYPILTTSFVCEIQEVCKYVNYGRDKLKAAAEAVKELTCQQA
jgi:hypothetical protein